MDYIPYIMGYYDTFKGFIAGFIGHFGIYVLFSISLGYFKLFKGYPILVLRQKMTPIYLIEVVCFYSSFTAPSLEAAQKATIMEPINTMNGA